MISPGTILPNPGYQEHLTAAWLLPDEARIMEAHLCADLQASLSVSVSIDARPDKRGRLRGVPFSRLTPGQKERAREAGALLDAWQQGAFGVAAILRRLAVARRETHYAKLGQEPPALPAAPSEESPS